MFAWPFLRSLLSPKLLIGVALAMACWFVYELIYDRGYDQAVAVLQPKIDLLEAEAKLAVKESERVAAEYRVKEQAWQAQLKEAQDVYALSQANTAKKLAKALAVADAHGVVTQRLRSDIAAYANAAPTTAGAAGPSDSAKAAALGALLGEALQLADAAVRASAESTAAAESTGNAVRALLEAWPS